MAARRVVSTESYLLGLQRPTILPVFGTQYGEESEGIAVALLAEHFDAFVRVTGGSYLGRPFIHNGKRLMLHQLPVGIIASYDRPETICALAGGVSIDPQTLLHHEIEPLKKQGLNLDKRLLIDGEARILSPFPLLFALLDRLVCGGTRAESLAAAAMHAEKFTLNGLLDRPRLHEYLDRMSDRFYAYVRTCAGTGTYAGKSADILDPLRSRIRKSARLPRHLKDMLILCLGSERERKQLEQSLYAAGRELSGMVADVRLEVTRLLRDDKRILAESARGVAPDIGIGTIPETTWCSVGALGAAVHLGIQYEWFSSPIGVAKWYMSKTGPGAFPTAYLPEAALEDLDYTAGKALASGKALRLLHDVNPNDAIKLDRYLRDATMNYDPVTGFPRMGGRYDALLTGHSAGMAGAGLFLYMLDMAAANPEQIFCMEYEYTGPDRMLNGHRFTAGTPVTRENFLAEESFLTRCRPVYHSLREMGAALSPSDLQALSEGMVNEHMNRFLSIIGLATGAPIIGVRYGPDPQEACFLQIE